jgi:hypothetical protein
MFDIEGIKKRLAKHKHFWQCAVRHCEQCNTMNDADARPRVAIVILSEAIESLLAEVERLNREYEAMQNAALSEGNGARAIANELDELRTRHARLIDSTDTFVAALVDERFKKDHASMLAELHTLRVNAQHDAVRIANIEKETTHVRLVVASMPETVRAIFESARVEAKSKGVALVRALVDMVAHSRMVCAGLQSRNGEQADRIVRDDDRIRALGIERNGLKESLIVLRDECRKHLARINVLESENAEALAHPRMIEIRNGETLSARPGDKIKVVLTIGSDATTLPANESTGQDVAKVEDNANDATSTNVVPDDVCARAATWANAKIKCPPCPDDVQYVRNVVNGVSPACESWQTAVREFVKLWREGRAPDMPHTNLRVGQRVRITRGMCASSHTGTVKMLHDNGQVTVEWTPQYSACAWPNDIDVVESSESLCTCPATSEYDDLCPRHGLVGIGVTPRN